MVKFTVKQKLQALNLLKEGYSSHSVAQMIGTRSHQLIDTWAAQYQQRVIWIRAAALRKPAAPHWERLPKKVEALARRKDAQRKKNEPSSKS